MAQLMRHDFHIGGRFLAACVAALLLVPASAVASDPATTVVRVEEDWVALIGEPDQAISSPQICNVIAPGQSLTGVFGQIQINHRGYPEFQEGGVQVQGMVGESVVNSINGSRTVRLFRNSDNLRYTVVMAKVPTGIQVGVRNIRSRTWGTFATNGIHVTVPTPDNSLNNYSPDFSLENSMVTLGSHRLSIFYITAIRKTFADGRVETDDTDRVSHSYQLNVQDVPLELYEANPDDYNTDITEVP